MRYLPTSTSPNPTQPGCGSKPMVPFWGRCTTHFRTYLSGWIGMFTRFGYYLALDPQPPSPGRPPTARPPTSDIVMRSTSKASLSCPQIPRSKFHFYWAKWKPPLNQLNNSKAKLIWMAGSHQVKTASSPCHFLPTSTPQPSQGPPTSELRPNLRPPADASGPGLPALGLGQRGVRARLVRLPQRQVLGVGDHQVNLTGPTGSTGPPGWPGRPRTTKGTTKLGAVIFHFQGFGKRN